VLLQLFIPGLTSGSQLESDSEFEIVTQLANTGKRPSSHLYSLWFRAPSSCRREPAFFILSYLGERARDRGGWGFPFSRVILMG
jgi:hypothetical protein